MGKVRTQVLFDEEDYRNIKREAFERGISMSAVVREMCRERYVGGKTTIKNREAALRFIGAGRDTKSDVAERHDDYLYGDAE